MIGVFSSLSSVAFFYAKERENHTYIAVTGLGIIIGGCTYVLGMLALVIAMWMIRIKVESKVCIGAF